VSKRHGQRKKRGRPKPPAACPRCHAPADASPGALLRALAAVLNSCADAKLKVRFSHGAVLTREGYVLPLGGGRWTARTLAYDPLSPAEDPAGDGMED
jgi:hypothetical protein